MDVCNFIRKKMAKISHRKLSEILKRSILQNPYRETSVLESIFNKIAWVNTTEPTDSEINSIDQQLYRKEAYTKEEFPVNTSKLSVLFQKCLT